MEKTNLGKINNIKILHFFEDEVVFKLDIIKSMINIHINNGIDKIYARKTIIQEISNEEYKNFLDKNHIQGYIYSPIRIGLYYNDILVSVMGFNKVRKVLGFKSNLNDYELTRFCNKINTSVIGGASKLFTYFIRNYEFNRIISYANKRYSDGNLYKKLKFDYVKDTNPNYFYIKCGEIKRYHRYNFRKHKLIEMGYDESKTENEIMNELNYHKIYDCGNMKFEYKKGE